VTEELKKLIVLNSPKPVSTMIKEFFEFAIQETSLQKEEYEVDADN